MCGSKYTQREEKDMAFLFNNVLSIIMETAILRHIVVRCKISSPLSGTCGKREDHDDDGQKYEKFVHACDAKLNASNSIV